MLVVNDTKLRLINNLTKTFLLHLYSHDDSNGKQAKTDLNYSWYTI